MKRLNDVIRLLGLLVTAAAIYQEMKKPPEERTWHGRVADFVPYDFRPPTFDRVKERIWNPDNADILVPTVFGVGWTANLASVYRLAQTFYLGWKEGAA